MMDILEEAKDVLHQEAQGIEKLPGHRYGHGEIGSYCS